MFPFKTNSQKLHTNRSVFEIESFLKQKISDKKLLQITYDNAFYGQVETQRAKFALGQIPVRNAFRPVVVMEWKALEKGSAIETYFRLEDSNLALFSILPVMGLYFAFQQKLLLPFIVALVLELLLVGSIYLLYSKSKQSTIKGLEALLNECGAKPI